MDHLKEHNSKLMDLTEIKEQCYQKYRLDNTPFFDICNISFEYPCFRTDTDDPFNLTRNRPCINLTQIGDGITDCLSGLDERNRLQCARKGMLGFHFEFDENLCAAYRLLCTSRHPWNPGTNIAYDTVCFHQERRYKNGTDSNCNNLDDVMCLNDVCIKEARCNGVIECLHGEDEYRCIPKGVISASYRWEKTAVRFQILMVQNYPPAAQLSQKNHRNDADPELSHDLTSKSELVENITTVYEKRNSEVKSVYRIVRDSLGNDTITFEEYYLPFICNRGVAVKYYTDHTVCFCPPSFYGSQCEFYSDRITVVTHLDLTNYRLSFHQIAVIKVLTTFLFEDRIIDYYEFHVNPQYQNENNYIKQSIYFLYPRIETFIEMKKNNRSGTQLYNVRVEAFKLHLNETIEPIGVWQYPIYFDFLPAFRLSKILRFPLPGSSFPNGPCLNNTCGKNGLCLEVINSNHSSYFCSCNRGYHGNHCEFYYNECNNYCSPKSLCKPTYRGMLTENQYPLCLCPVSTFGSSCYIKDNNCQKNPCLHGGSCLLTYDLTDISSYTCLCTDSFEGDHCKMLKGTVNIIIVLSPNSTLQLSDVVATTVSYSDYDQRSFRFLVRHQQVYNTLPSHFQLIYSHKLNKYAPTTAILKVYRTNYHREQPDHYVLYFYPKEKVINIKVDLTSENRCPLVQSNETSSKLLSLFLDRKVNLFMLGYSNISTTAVFLYHRICQAKQNSSSIFTCFRDSNYLCICEADHYRAECFGYNPLIDQCSLCLSNGYCLKGELEEKSDFMCLCPHCHFGKLCQFSNELMSFTLDSLMVKDVENNSQISIGVYISIAILIFLFGFFSNLCSFLTFIRPKPRKVGVGNYLLIVSIVDQCSLLLLLLKIIHIIFGSNGTLFSYESYNLYSCKVVSYLLSVFTRTTYWLTSFVTIERLCAVLFPTSITMKNPHLALAMTVLTILAVSGMHVHEVLHYMTIVDLSYTSVNVSLCVTNYVQSLVSSYNRVNVLFHYFIPFLIQVISITILIVQIACSRARASGNSQQTFADLFKKLFKSQKEQYITPIIIVLSSLPQAILSFSYACSELKQSWQRYTLLTAYFLSYLPQMLGFILYVLPSTTYSAEFRQTVVGRRLMRQQRTPTTRQNNTKMKTLLTTQTITSS
jgi:hypothetical protein